MYLLQLVQALKYENFSDIVGGLEPGSKKDGQGLSDDSAMDRSALGGYNVVSASLAPVMNKSTPPEAWRFSLAGY